MSGEGMPDLDTDGTGLTVTIVWIYTNILRILAIINND